MTRQMAVEYAQFGIRVNTIACGTVDTPIVHKSAEASGDPDKYWAMLRNAIHRAHCERGRGRQLLRLHGYRPGELLYGSHPRRDGGYTARSETR